MLEMSMAYCYYDWTLLQSMLQQSITVAIRPAAADSYFVRLLHYST